MCPKAIESTFYAFVTAVINAGYLLSYQLGGLLTFWLGITSTNFDSLWILITISSVFPILTLFFLFIMPSENKISLHGVDNISNKKDKDTVEQGEKDKILENSFNIRSVDAVNLTSEKLDQSLHKE
jgi:hypothetical protein